jgi:osmotically inducible protein OsmC
MAERTASVTWKGNLTEGKGVIDSVGSGAFGSLPVTWAARTEASNGLTSPEELLAAAHASCYAMACSNELNKLGNPPERLNVTATCTADRVDGKFTVLSMDLDVRASVPGIDRARFTEATEAARAGCPISRALASSVKIRLHATLEK